MPVRVWCGSEKPEYENERRLARRLAERLAVSREDYSLLCNVYIRGGGRADFVLLASRAIFIIELKHVQVPLYAPLNGPWKKRLGANALVPLYHGQQSINVYNQVRGYQTALRDWLRAESWKVFAPDKQEAVRLHWIRNWPQALIAIEPALHPESVVEQEKHIPVVGANEVISCVEINNVGDLDLTPDEHDRLAAKLGCTRWPDIYSDHDSYVFDQTRIVEDRTRTFVGRGEALTAIDDFLSSHDRGYFFIEAPPGAGKSALLAYLVKTRRFTHHFVNKDGRENDPPAIARSILASLIRKYNLAIAIPDAEEVLERRFIQGLSDVSSALAHSGAKEVIVVDGLDELDYYAHQKIRLFPDSLPAGVYFIVSGRPGSMKQTVRPDTVHCDYELPPLDKCEIEQLLNKEGIYPTPDQLDKIWDRTEGNALFLVLMLAAGRKELPCADTPHSLRVLLDELLRDTYRPDSVERAVAVALSVARGPLSHRQLVLLLQREPREVRLALDVLQQVLRETGSGYEFYHRLLQDYVLDEVASLEDVTDCHRRLARCCEGDREEWFAYSLAHLLSHAKAASGNRSAAAMVTPWFLEKRRRQGATKLQVMRDLETAWLAARDSGADGLADLFRLSVLRFRENQWVWSIDVAPLLAAMAKVGRVEEALSYAEHLDPEARILANTMIADSLLEIAPPRAQSLLLMVLEDIDSLRRGVPLSEATGPLQGAAVRLCKAFARASSLNVLFSRAPFEEWPGGALLWAAAVVPEGAPYAEILLRYAARRLTTHSRSLEDQTDPVHLQENNIDSHESESSSDSRAAVWPDESERVSYHEVSWDLLYPEGPAMSPMAVAVKSIDPGSIQDWITGIFRSLAEPCRSRVLKVARTLSAALALAHINSELATALLELSWKNVALGDSVGEEDSEEEMEDEVEWPLFAIPEGLWDNCNRFEGDDRSRLLDVLGFLLSNHIIGCEAALCLASMGFIDQALGWAKGPGDPCILANLALIAAKRGDARAVAIIDWMLAESDSEIPALVGLPLTDHRECAVPLLTELAVHEPERAVEMSKAIPSAELRIPIEIAAGVARRKGVGEVLGAIMTSDEYLIQRRRRISLGYLVTSSIASIDPLLALEFEYELIDRGLSPSQNDEYYSSDWLGEVMREALANGLPVSEIVSRLHNIDMQFLLRDADLTASIDSADLVDLVDSLMGVLRAMNPAEAVGGWQLLARTLDRAGRTTEAQACYQIVSEWIVRDDGYQATFLQPGFLQSRITDLTRAIEHDRRDCQQITESHALEARMIIRDVARLRLSGYPQELLRLSMDLAMLLPDSSGITSYMRPYWSQLNRDDLLIIVHAILLKYSHMSLSWPWAPAAVAPLLFKIGGCDLLTEAAQQLLGIAAS